MSGLEKEELTSRIKGMSEEELELVVALIPRNLILKRIEHDFEKLEVVKNCALTFQKEWMEGVN